MPGERSGRPARSRRSLGHLAPEAATVLRSAGLRPADLRAASVFRTHGLTVAGVGTWAARRAADRPVLIDDDGPVDGIALRHLVAGRADELRGVGATVLSRGDDRHLVATLIAAGTVGVDVVLVGPRAGADELAAAHHRARQLRSGGHRAAGRSPAVILHSSGTTGRPHPRTQGPVGLAQLPTLVSLIAALGLRRGEPMLVAAPISHGHGLSALAAGLLLGAPVLLGAARHPDRGIAQLVKHRVRTWVGLPAQLGDLITTADAHAGRDPSTEATALRRLRRIVTGSAPLPAELATEVHRRLGPVLVNYYGSTEAGTVTIARPADLAAVPATVGRPATGVQIEIRDHAGRVAPVGQVGDVALRSQWRAAGEPTWVHSKDRGRMDEAGRLVLVGRSDDAVLVGGHVVSVAAVTTWLRSQPGVRDVAVSVRPDERLGSVLVARVCGPVELPVLHAWARAALGDAAAPRTLLPWTSR